MSQMFQRSINYYYYLHVHKAFWTKTEALISRGRGICEFRRGESEASKPRLHPCWIVGLCTYSEWVNDMKKWFKWNMNMITCEIINLLVIWSDIRVHQIWRFRKSWKSHFSGYIVVIETSISPWYTWEDDIAAIANTMRYRMASYQILTID